jgi:hypothetical protein
VAEGGDNSDATISSEIKAAVKTLGASFISYATQQVTELLAGVDDPVVVSYCDYYYNAVQIDPENGLAKDALAVIDATKDKVAERRGEIVEKLEKLAPPVEITGSPETPPNDKLEKLEAENTDLRKAVELALPQLTDMAARLQKLENMPMPRAPRNVLGKNGEGAGSSADTRLEAAQELIKNHTPDQIATMLIKAAQGHPIQMVGGR